MNAEEDGIAVEVGDGRAIVEAEIRVVVACQYDAKALPLEFHAQESGENESDVLFSDAVCSAPAGVDAAMRRIKHNQRPDVRRGRRRNLHWHGLRR